MKRRVTICPRCKTREKTEGGEYCRECYRTVKTAQRQRRAIKAESLGLCSKCFKRPHAPGRKLCEACIARGRKVYRSRAIKRPLRGASPEQHLSLLADAAACRDILARMKEEKKK